MMASSWLFDIGIFELLDSHEPILVAEVSPA